MKIATYTGRLGRLEIVDGAKVPVAIILTKKDRENIANMAPDAIIYAMFPDDQPRDVMKHWLDMLREQEEGKA